MSFGFNWMLNVEMPTTNIQSVSEIDDTTAGACFMLRNNEKCVCRH
jgi:hypothetical protein